MIELTTQQWIIVGVSAIGVFICAYYLVKTFRKKETPKEEFPITTVEVTTPKDTKEDFKDPPKEVIPGLKPTESTEIKPNIQKDIPKGYPFETYN